MIVPSRYEEPFGVVALEGLACGCLPIVAERGGLVDAIGPHGLTFPNGDHSALANRLHDVLVRPVVAAGLLQGSPAHLQEFRAETVAKRYLAVFGAVLDR